MKATEYYEKYKEKLSAVIVLDSDKATPEERRKVVDDLLASIDSMTYDMMNEFDRLRIERRAQSNKALISIMKELNDKWNKICRLFEKDFGESPVKEDVIKSEFQKIYPNIIIGKYW